MEDDARMVPIDGNTFPVKDRLKELGARWDTENKVWMVPEALAATARRIVSSARPDDAWFRSPNKRSWGEE